MTSKAKTGKANGEPVRKASESDGRQTVKADAVAAKKQSAKQPKTPKEPTRSKGLWGIVAGSRKEQVAAALTSGGRDAAIAKANALGIQAGSAKGWIAFWKKQGHWSVTEAPKATGPAKPVTNSTATPAESDQQTQV